jgi:hypothetical protein
MLYSDTLDSDKITREAFDEILAEEQKLLADPRQGMNKNRRTNTTEHSYVDNKDVVFLILSNSILSCCWR